MSEISEIEIKSMTKEQNYMRGYLDGKQDVLDKIRDEIKEKFEGCDICERFNDYDYEENSISEYWPVGSIDMVLDIIDKHTTERSEE